jgi:hydroxyacyl-ACP dehydratase HTD2-like protein with hotdog domain
MKMYTILVAILAGLFSVNASADWYGDISYNQGGDEIDIFTTSSGGSVATGAGLKFAFGIQNALNEEETLFYRLAAGYMFDSIHASNGDVETDTFTLDAMLIINSGVHSFGIGGTMHISPEYSDNVEGYSSMNVKFEDATGLVLQYGYHFSPDTEVGIRYTNLDYKFGSASFDASGIGLFLSNGF